MVDTPSKADIANLVVEYHQAVYRYAYRLTGSIQDAEDLTQHAFLIAQSHIDKLRKIECVQSWLFTILRNCFLRSKQRRRPVSAIDIRLSMDSIPEKPHSEDIDQERLQEALDRLPDASRLVLVMFYFEDCSYREIAEKMRLPIGTVMSRLARAKAYLRSMLFEPEHHQQKPHSSGNLESILR